MKYDKFIYRFLDKKGKVIYIGKTKNLIKRIQSHKTQGHLPRDCYDKIEKTEVLVFCTKADHDIAEQYYIQKYQPTYNTFQTKRKLTFPIPFLDNQKWLCYQKTKTFIAYNFVSKQEETYYLLDSHFLKEDEVLESIKSNPNSILRLSKPTETMILTALKFKGSLIEAIADKTDEYCEIASQTYPPSIKYMKKPTNQSCLENMNRLNAEIKLILLKNGLLIKNVKYITPELAEIAVKQNGLALRYIPEEIQNDVICKYAIEQNANASRYIKYKKDELLTD